MKATNSKIGRNDICPCGSGLKFKKCCMNKNEESLQKTKKFSISEVISLLKMSLENLSIVNKDVKNIVVKKIELLNNRTLECQIYTKAKNSIDIKIEIGAAMSALHGFFVDDVFGEISFVNYAVRVFDSNEVELMNAISSESAAALMAKGNAIDWMKSTIFQENTEDYRLGIAKRQISEIEKALRHVIVDRLKSTHGNNWFILAIGRRLRESVIDTYNNQFGIEIDNGEILINYTFLLQLKKIICTNWRDFSNLFENKIQFEEFILELNSIRREEAHNRSVSETHLLKLKEIYEFMLIGITEKYPNILPYYLIDNWKNQLKEIMLEKLNSTYSDNEILGEKNSQLKLLKSITNLQELIDHIKDKELRLKSVVTPVQKKKIHEELIGILENYRILHEELMKSGKAGDMQAIEKKQKELELYKVKLDSFAEKYVLQES